MTPSPNNKENKSEECLGCGLTRHTCEMEGGDEWVRNCQKIEGKKHEFEPVTKINQLPPEIPKEGKKKICGTYAATLHGKDIYCSNFVPCKVHSPEPSKGERCAGCNKCTQRAMSGEECVKMGICPCHYNIATELSKMKTLNPPQSPLPSSEKWEDMKEVLRNTFDELFPKDQEAIDGIRPSKSNRSSALVLWGMWEGILKSALSQEKEKSYADGYADGITIYENTYDAGYRSAIEEIEKWAYNNGIMDKKSFVALIRFLKALSEDNKK